MAGTVHRTARIALRPTPAQRRRCFGLLVAAGDVWATVIDCNATLRRWRCPGVANFQALSREITGMRFGELPRHSAEDVLKRYASAFFETAKRRKNGERAGFPRRKHRFVTVRFRKGSFSVREGRVVLATARGCPPLSVRIAREIPYSPDSVRSVTLVVEGNRLFLDVTASVPVEDHGLDPASIAGVDLGIIHPFAVAFEDSGLLVSGRALRAEHRLHLDDTKRRSSKTAHRTPKKGQRGSRRWKKTRTRQRKQEARHRRRVRQAHHEAAKQVVTWCIERKVGRLVVGDPKGITGKDVGHNQNLRLRQWGRTHLMAALKDKAERAGIVVELVGERGTSSTCPGCGSKVSKPKGRRFCCTACGLDGHRDLVGARNIAAIGGGKTSATSLVMHRRAGTAPARRDRRRHLFDRRRSCPAPGRPQRESLAGSSRRGSRKPLIRQGDF